MKSAPYLSEASVHQKYRPRVPVEHSLDISEFFVLGTRQSSRQAGRFCDVREVFPFSKNGIDFSCDEKSTPKLSAAFSAL
jgi:hypothetical protein